MRDDTGVDMVLGMCAAIRDKNMDSGMQDWSYIERDDEFFHFDSIPWDSLG